MPAFSLFTPKTIAVVGASHRSEKIGTQILNNIIRGGFKGNVYPVNPKGGTILGLKTYPSLSDIPQAVDLAIIALKAPIATTVIEEATKLKVQNLVVISAGFKESSETGAVLENKIKTLIKNSHTRLLGVNCLGLLSYADPQNPLNATFLNKMPENGQVAFASQSGAFGSAVVDWADKINLGFKYFVSLGNKTDINEVDLLQAWANDDQVKVIALYLENIVDGASFLKAIKQITPKKPVIILMPGASEKAQKAITSHTGSLVNNQTVLNLVFDKYNLIRAKHMRQFFKLILLTNVLEKNHQKQLGKKSIILTNAGGPGVLAVDLIHQAGLSLVSPSKTIKNQLGRFLPEAASLKNPVDILGDAQADRYQQALEVLIQEPEVNQIFIILTPQTITEVAKTAQVIVDINQQTNKLLVPVFIGGTDVKVGLDLLRQAGIPAYSYIVDAVEAVSKVDSYYQNRAVSPSFPTNDLSNQPISQINPKLKSQKQQVKQFLKEVNQKLTKLDFHGRLDPTLTDQLLKLIGLNLPSSIFLKHNEDLTSKNQPHFPFPWVIKLASSAVLHNTDLKAVYPNIKTKDQANQAIGKLKQLIAKNQFNQSSYVQIQPQIENLVELLVGLKKDDDFGFVLVVGSGGIYTNLYQDITQILLPTTRQEIQLKLAQTKVSKLINGYRGSQKLPLERLIDQIEGVANLTKLMPNLKEADFNPVILNSKGAFLVDAKLVF